MKTMILNADEMTVDQCRDWRAERLGWQKTSDLMNSKGSPDRLVWYKNGRTLRFGVHPIAPTLDEAAKALPSYWMLRRVSQTDAGWDCSASKPLDIVQAEGTTELEARWRLAVKADPSSWSVT